MLLSAGCGIKPQHEPLGPGVGTAQRAAQLQIKLLRCLTVPSDLSTVPRGGSASLLQAPGKVPEIISMPRSTRGAQVCMGQGRNGTVSGSVHQQPLFLSYFILTVALKLASVHDVSFSILNMKTLQALDDARSVRFTLGLSMHLHRKQKSYTSFWGYIALNPCLTPGNIVIHSPK